MTENYYVFLYIFFFSALPCFRSKSIMDQSRIFWTRPKWKIKRLLQSGIGPWYKSDVFPCLYFLVRKEVFAKIILVFLDQKPKVFRFLYPMSRQYKLSVRPTTQKTGFNKGQLMSERNFGVFKSPIQPNRLVGFWGDLKKPKFPSEINWPLPGAKDWAGKKVTILYSTLLMVKSSEIIWFFNLHFTWLCGSWNHKKNFEKY